VTRESRAAQVLLRWAVVILLLRLLSLPWYPLTDTTEARYALVARLMAESGDWITPWFSPGVPFWGKPPLAFWATAGLFELIGFSEFAARLGTWLPSALSLWWMWRWAQSRCGAPVAALATLVLSSSLLFFICAGSVLTDTWLMLCITISLLGFWDAISGDRAGAWWGFSGLGLGLLAKGPLVLVLLGPPVLLAMIQRRSWGALKPRVVFAGTALMLLIAVPWYWAAELKTPGFLDYFIVGEHWHRFLDPGWSGDRYGTAHREPRGMMLVFALLSLMPWTLACVGWRPSAAQSERALQWYLAVWALWPAVFFSMARNVLPTYMLTSLPAAALLLASGLRIPEASVPRWMLGMAAPVPLALVVALAIWFGGHLNLRSERDLVAVWQQRGAAEPLYSLGAESFSLQLYSDAQVRPLPSEPTPKLPYWVAVRKGAEPPAGAIAVFRDRAYTLYRAGGQP
jgi:4-amino-4-deoxy-L-arabinose transferase-like glycosyltransferase